MMGSSDESHPPTSAVDNIDDIDDKQQLLHESCRIGDFKTTISIVESGCNPNFFIDGESPLHVCARENHADILVALLISPEGLENEGEKRSVRLTADAYTVDESCHYNALHWAVSLGNLESISLLSFLHPKLVHQPDKRLITPLQQAIDGCNKFKSFPFSFLPFQTSRNEQIVNILKQSASDRSHSYQVDILTRRHKETPLSPLMHFLMLVLSENGFIMSHILLSIFLVSLITSTFYALHFHKIASYSLDLDSQVLCKLNIALHILVLTTVYLVRSTPPGYYENKHGSRRSREYESYYGQLLVLASGVQENSNSFCHICQVYRHPERKIRHCHEVGKCIEMYHYHCRFLGVPVGQKNFAHFISFLFILTVVSIPLDIYLYLRLRSLNMTCIVAADIYFIWLLLVWLYLFLLLFFHVYISFLGSTSNEFME